ncbi:DUF222 domain-containing protein [Microbacterium sp. P5_E9]
MIDPELPPDPQEFADAWPGDVDGAPAPDALDGVLEIATMEAVFAAQKLRRVDVMRRELLAVAERAGLGVGEVIERGIRLELATALRVTEYAAGRMITLAAAFVHRYPAVLESLAGGRITLKHAEILADAVDELMPELRDAVAARALVLAEAEPVGTFRRGLHALIEKAQAPTIEERWAAAVKNRRVVLEPGKDGAGLLLIYAPIVELHAIYGRATAIAKTIVGRDARDGDGDTRALDQVRTDVICDLLIDGFTDAMPTESRGIRATAVVTAPVLALLSDEAALNSDLPVVEGIGPIPVSVARELCGGDASWMRVLTHPETGMVLSVGRDQYRPPAALRRLIKWRADRCMAPGCGMPASRCQIDHQVPWEHGGETSLQNHAPLCQGHHTVRHHGNWEIRQIPGSGGAIEWTSPTGRIYVVQPERKVPVFTIDPTAGAEPLPPF